MFLLLLLAARPTVAVVSAETSHANDSDSCDEDELDFDEYENQVVVKLADPAQTDVIQSIATTLNLQVVDTVLASKGIYLLEVAAGGDADDLDDQIEDGWGAQIVYAEANYIGDIPEANPRGSWAWGGSDAAPANTQYASELLNLTAAHSASTGTGIVVAVLDTGVQLNHPFFGDALVAGYDFVDDDTVPDDVNEGIDSDGDNLLSEAAGHGTHVAGIVHTVAPDAKIMPLRVLDSDGAGSIFAIAEAITYAAENGADIISLSLGSTFESDVLEDAVEDAVDQYGVLIVAAAGNGDTSQRQYPAGFDEEVLAVTSINEHSIKAASANYGCWVDIAAPGEQIFSAFPVNEYAWWSGTSMATPFIAGGAALIMSANNGQRNPQDVLSVIQNSADSIASENPTLIGQLGAGRANFAAAVGVTPELTAIQLQNVETTSASLTPFLIWSMAFATTIALILNRTAGTKIRLVIQRHKPRFRPN